MGILSCPDPGRLELTADSESGAVEETAYLGTATREGFVELGESMELWDDGVVMFIVMECDATDAVRDGGYVIGVEKN
jgi:hypothetical protein